MDGTELFALSSYMESDRVTYHTMKYKTLSSNSLSSPLICILQCPKAPRRTVASTRIIAIDARRKNI